MPQRAKTTNKWWKTEGVLGRTFATQEDLKVAIRAIINPAPLGEPLSDTDQAFLVGVLKHHHDWEAKRGPGIEYIEVRMNPGTFGSTRGLWLQRSDGTEIDISWVVPLKPGGQSTVKETVCAAARREVIDQVLTVRMGQCGELCPICSTPLVGSVHVDHRPPKTFDTILSDFLRHYGYSYESIEVEDFGIHCAFENRALAADWQQYHAQEADLRLIHKHENLARVG